MSSKGENKKSKTISMPRAINTSRKNNYWVVKTKAGPHSKQTSVPLGVVLRDYAKVGVTMTDTKHILNNKEIKVNGVIRYDHQFPVGLFDVISIEKQKLFFRMVFDTKERMVLKPMEKESNEKISKVSKKIMTSKGIQITTTDGRTYYGIKANVGDSVKLALPEAKVTEVIEMKEGNLAYVTKGAHCTQIAPVKEIVLGTQRRDELVKLSDGEKEFETTTKNIIIIGKNKSEMVDIQ